MTPWYTSKTIWANAIAAAALIIQSQYGFIVDPEVQAGLLAIINLVLRLITKTPVAWNVKPAEPSAPPTSEAGYIRLPALWFLLAALTCMFYMTGCSGPRTASGPGDTPLQTAGKSLLAAKTSIVTAATATDALCKTGTLAQDKCTLAKRAYETAKPSYDTAVDAYLLMSTGEGNAADFGAALLRLQNLTAHILLITDPLGPKGGAQ